MNNSKELTLKRSLRAKKIITCITSGLCAGVLMSMTAFAAGAVDTSDFIDKASKVLTALLSLIGGGLALWGLVGLLEAYSEGNGAGKSSGIKQLMAGIAIIMIGVVMIPVLKNMMTAATA